MPRIDVTREVQLERTPRVLQTEGIFDLEPSSESRKQWSIDVELPKEWNVGLIVGPSGAGKTSFAREALGDHIVDSWDWSDEQAIVDGFPEDMTIQDITGLLSSVGFSSPPAWLKPYSVLSNGEKFRVDMARTLAEMEDMAVVDEFTSVIDRTVAQIGSAAIQKTVRKQNKRFVAISCHYDVLDWLDPDWVIEPHLERFQRRSLRRRPPIEVDVRRANKEMWSMFEPYHYLTGELNKSAKCFVAYIWGVPAAFTSVIAYMGKKGVWRGHRTVVRPDFQGIGLGARLVDHVAAICAAAGNQYTTQTSHPALIGYRHKSPNWQMRRAPDLKSALKKKMGSDDRVMRLMASFDYCGPPADESTVELWHE